MDVSRRTIRERADASGLAIAKVLFRGLMVLGWIRMLGWIRRPSAGKIETGMKGDTAKHAGTRHDGHCVK